MNKKLWIVMILFPVLLGAFVLSDDQGRRAFIEDENGVTFFATGLHYCFKEEEGEDLFLNKYDDLFVRRGKAEIRVRLDSLAELEFLGKTRQDGAVKLLEARLVTKDGREAKGEVVCHQGGFITGQVDLGDMTIELGDIRKMVFNKGPDTPHSALLCHLAGKDAPLPARAVKLDVGEAGKLIDERGSEVGLADLKAMRGSIFVLRAASGLRYETMRSVLELIEKSGAREIILAR